jgi:small subunit ribosomal protein S3
MKRTETTILGSIPLATLWSNIDYGTAQAFCTYGVIGVKVWIYKGVHKGAFGQPIVEEPPHGVDAKARKVSQGPKGPRSREGQPR